MRAKIGSIGDNPTGARRFGDRIENTTRMAERFIEQFGFRGIEFGNWVTQDERIRWLDGLTDALPVLAKTLRFSENQIGTIGTASDKPLALAIGARGRPLIPAAAHYEQGEAYRTINLSRSSGRGSFVHEYGHAIDYTIDNPWSEGEEWLTLMQEKLTNYMEATRVWNENYDIRPKQFPADYYSQPIEVFARSFEAYVHGRIGIVPWLNDGVERCPQGREAYAVRPVFTKLLRKLR